MRLKSKIGLLAGAAVVFVGGACVVSATQDAAWLRTRLAAAVQANTGRQLQVDRLHVWLLPFPWVEARGVRLSGVEEGGPALLQAETVRARLALMPLFHHRIVLDDVSLTHAHLVVRRLGDGRADWQFTPIKAEAGAAEPVGPSHGQMHWNLGLTSLQVSHGSVQWQDAVRHWTGELPLDSFKLSHLEKDAPTLEATIEKGKGRLNLVAHTSRLTPTLTDPLSVDMKLTFLQDEHPAGLAHIDGSITDPAGKRSYSLNFGGSLGQLQAVQLFFPHANLPQGSNISLDGLVGGEGATPLLQGVHIRAADVDFSRFLPASNLTRLQIDASRPEDNLAIQIEGKIGDQNMGLRGTAGTLAQLTALLQDPNHTETPIDLAAVNGASTLRVSGMVGGGHSALDIHGALDRLTVGDNYPTAEGLKADGHLEAQDTVALARSRDKAALIGGVTGAVEVQAQHVAWQGQDWAQASAHVVVQNGRLVLDPITAVGQGVQQSGRVAYSVSAPVPQIDVAARPVLLPLAGVQQVLGVPKVMQGTLTLVGAVSAQGVNADELRQSVAGHVGASAVDGEIGGAALRTLLGPQVPLKGKMPVRCLGGHAQLAGGVANFDVLGLESDFLSLRGHGSVGLTSQALDLYLSPHVLLGGATAGSDVQVRGTLADPQPKMVASYGGRYGITIGGDDGGGDNCPALLSASREGAVGPAAQPPAQHKGGKVMNMLRGLGLFQ